MSSTRSQSETTEVRSTPGHTPGPWRMSDLRCDDNLYAYISAPDWSQFAKVVVRIYGNPLDNPIGIANARLIAAAPDLLEALKWFADPGNWRSEELSDGVYFSAEWRPGFSPIEIARAAINRATGAS